MNRSEIIRLFRSGYTPPCLESFKSDGAWLLEILRNMVITWGDTILEPLTNDNVFPKALRLADGWGDGPLRQGYIPTLPMAFDQIYGVANCWANSDMTAIYFYGNSSRRNPVGYIRTTLSNNPPGRYIFELSYGNLTPDSLSQGYTSTAIALFVRNLIETCSSTGIGPWRIETAVSSKNLPSRRILEKNGFTQDNARQITPSPTAMGGDSIPMVLDQKQI